MKERLQKLISQAGLASRRKAEEMIIDGRVRVNGRKITELGTKADINVDRITVDGKPLISEKLVYFVFNKPKGVLTTLQDPQHRSIVTDYLPKVKERIYPVGRLDLNTEGLIVLTNDGELTHLLEHPSSEIEKEYEVKIKGMVSEAALIEMSKGIKLEDGITAPATVEHAGSNGKTGITTIYITIHEGRNRQVRRMFEHFGYRIHNLKRVRFAFLTLQGLKRGSYRRLSPSEVKQLYECVRT